MALGYNVPRGRKKGVSPISVAVLALIAAIVVIIIVSLVSLIVSAESKGDVLKLSIEWTAEQNSSDDHAKLTVNLYVNFDDMNVTARKNNTLTVNGQTKTFDSGNIRGSSSKTQKKLLTTQEFEVLRKPGESVNYKVEATWNFNGKTPSGMLETIDFYEIITLDNYSVKMSTPPTVDQTASPDETTPEETTKSPETETTAPPVVQPVVTEPPIVNPELPENAVYKTKEISSISGSKFLNTVANCTVVENGKTDKYGNRLATVTVKLTFEYYSLYMSKREDCVLQVGDKVLNFEIPAINENVPAQHRMVVAELSTDVRVGTKLKIYARIPLVTSYGTETVNDIIIDDVMEIY